MLEARRFRGDEERWQSPSPDIMALRGCARIGDLLLAEDGCSAGAVSVAADEGSPSMESSA